MRVDLPPPNLIDRVVGYFNPAAGVRRFQARAALGVGYSAVKKSRHNRNRETTGGDADRHLDQRTLWDLREISRDLLRENGLASGCVERSVENVFGAEGFDLIPKTDHDDTDKWVADDWREWLANDADIKGEFHGWELIKQFGRSEYGDGDHFVQTDDEGINGNGSLRPFEGDRVLTPSGVKGVNRFEMTNGIARDKSGRKRFLFVANKAPKFGSVSRDQGKAIPARNILHLYNPKRGTQGRGAPVLTSVIRDFDDLDDLLKYERIGAKLVAAQGFVVQSDDANTFAQMVRAADPGYFDDDGQLQPIEEIYAGNVNYLGKGQKIESVASNRPSNNFAEFVMLLTRLVGIPLGLPLELVLLDFSHTSFASSRMMLQVAQRHFRCEQFHFACFLSRLYKWWINLRVRNGHYAKSPALEGEKATIHKHEWDVPGWPSPRPIEDAKAIEIGIKNKFDSRTNGARRLGWRIDRIRKQLEEEAEWAKPRRMNTEGKDREGAA